VDSFIKEIGSHTCISLSNAHSEELCGNIDRALLFGRSGAEAATSRLREAERVNIEEARKLLSDGCA